MKRNAILRGHFWLLGFVLVHFAIESFSGFRLHPNVFFALKILLYVSGILLFFKSVKPFKAIAGYFSFYAISGTVTGLFFLFGGIFLAMLSSVLLFPIYPNDVRYASDNLKIYDHFQGLMSRCCSYEVAEPKYFLFEKNLGTIETENPLDKSDKFSLQNGKLVRNASEVLEIEP